MTLKLGVLGIDHGHIHGMLANMLREGCSCQSFWTEGTPLGLPAFSKEFNNLSRVERPEDILDDPTIGMVLISAIPADRAALAIRAMEAGKDVMTDKPGCTTLAQLAEIRACVARTGRIWSVNFSERFEVPAVTRASELVAEGAIGTVKQTLGIGPHRQGNYPRPDWFWQRERFGGILADIGSHQVDQFLHFTGSTQAHVAFAHAENTSRPDKPAFQDFGEMVLQGDRGRGYIKLDWFTPDALPTWGDGRFFITGDKGYIELRKYLDVARAPEGNQLYLVNGTRMERIDCNDAGLPYFPRLIADHFDRTQTANPQEQTFRTMELALTAQAMAEGRDA